MTIIGNESKGQVPFLSHTMMVAFSVVLIVLIVTTLNSVKIDYQEFVGKEEIIQVCVSIKSAIEKIYVPTGYTSLTNETMGSIVIDLPERIADVNYRMKFVNKTLMIETLAEPTLNQSCTIGFNASFEGSSRGGRTRLSWIRYTNITDVIQMAKV